MTMRKPFFGIALLFMLVCVLVAPTTAKADGVDFAYGGYSAEDLQDGATGSFSIDYDNDALDGVQVDLYRVADVSVQGFTFTSDFKPYVNDIEWLKDAGASINDSDWDVVAETFAAHALADGLTPMRTGTLVDGRVTFEDLPAGLYMIRAHSTTIDGYVYTFSPSIEALPRPSTDGGSASYEVTAEPKYSTRRVEVRTMRIVKHWVPVEGSNAVASVTSITVQILRDGVAWGDPIELSDANDWSYSWEDTEGTHEWSASETAINGSSVVWSRQVALTADNTIVLTNTEVNENPPTPPTTPDKPGTPTKTNLPQTGETWSIVPILLIAAFFSLGLSRFLATRRSRDVR